MRVYDASKFSFRDGKIYFRGKELKIESLKYCYISGFYSPTEYSDNLGCYSVILRTNSGSFTIAETTNKQEAKKALDYVGKLVEKNKDIKKYNNALVSLKYADKVEMQEENGFKVNITMSTGRKLRVLKSSFKFPAKFQLNKIEKDINNYKSTHRVL